MTQELARKKEVYLARRLAGQCVVCASPSHEGHVYCIYHKKQDLKRKKKRRNQRRNLGLCETCNQAARVGKVHCEICAEKARKRSLELYYFRKQKV